MSEKSTNPVVMYTDGACSGNPGPGGWGVWMQFGEHEKELCGGASDTTNNRMELQAAIEGLNALKRSCRVELYTDSQYLRQGILEWVAQWQQRGWRTADRKPVKNQDLWQALVAATQRHELNWHWVKGHAGIAGNERADELARRGLELHKNNSL